MRNPPSPIRDEEYVYRNSMPEPNSGCWLWMGATVNGYGRAKYGNTGVLKAHRLSYKLFKGPIPDGLLVRHLCNVRCCVNPDHLAIGTVWDNSQDSKKIGTTRSERHLAARREARHLSNDEMLKVRDMYGTGKYAYRELAEYFGTTIRVIGKVIRNAYAD